MNPQIAELGAQALGCPPGWPLDRCQADRLAQIQGDDLYDLFYWANAVRLKNFGRAVSLCSIAAGKVGGCSEDCKFCAQSARYHTQVQSSRTTTEQLVQSARQASAHGADAFGIVNSGRSPTCQDLDDLAKGYAAIAADGRLGSHADGGQGTDRRLMLCASLGCLSADQARRLAELGVRRYNHNLETSRRFFGQIVTTHTYDERIATLTHAKAAGLELCSGGIFNLGEDWSDRIDMALSLRELGVTMVPMNFLNPIPGTPLGDRPAMPAMDVLKVVAIYRLLLPTAAIKLAGGREVNLRDLQSWMFYCGATSCMVGNYLTTTGRPADQDRTMIADLGLTPRQGI